MGEAKSNLKRVGAEAAEPNRTKGITLKYGMITRPDLMSGLAKLDSFTGWKDSKDLYRFAKFKGTFDREEKKAGIYYRKLVDRHSEKVPVTKKSEITNQMEPTYDKDGKPITKPKFAPNAQGQMSIVMKDQAAFDADIRTFDNHEFTVQVYKFKTADLLAALLTPGELRACARIVDDLPEEMAPDDDDEEILRDEVTDDMDELEDDTETDPDGDVAPEEPAAHQEQDSGGDRNQPSQ